MAPANLGDLVPLGQALMNFTWWGYVTDIDTPTGVWATMEAVGDEAFVTMDVLQGPRGLPGQNAPLVQILWDAAIEEPDDLPEATLANQNKGYWINDLVYISTGTQWIPKRPGPTGPAGPVPIISTSGQILTWQDQLDGVEPQVQPSGPPSTPHLLFDLPQGPPGPPGPAGPIRGSVDYMEPEDGPLPQSKLTWNETEMKYEPKLDPQVRFFTVPEGAFTNFSGFATRQQVLAFQLPPIPWDVQIKVGGHIRAVGLEVDKDPLIIGAEVRLGHATSGQLIGRGFGNISTWTTFDSHYSTGGAAMDAVTPDGELGRLPAMSTGQAATVYVNLYNDGLFGLYNFNKGGAQLDLLLIPV